MKYEMRVFGRAEQLPTPKELIKAAQKDSEHKLSVVDDEDDEQPEGTARDWERVAISYDAERKPIVLSVQAVTTERDCPGAEDVRNYIDRLEDADDADPDTLDDVLAYLSAAVIIVKSEVSNDIDDVGFAVNQTMLNLIAEKTDGAIYAEGEGFYLGEELVVEME